MLKFYPLALLGCLASFTAQASIFGPPPTDESIQILGMIFGPNIGHVPLGGQANPGLNQMFELFNNIVVTIGIIIVSYIGVVSLVNTAQDGKAMGKKWAGIWIPLRSVLGMGLLVPTPGSGYSVIQAGVMWLVMQGIGAADHVWGAVLDNFQQNNHTALSGVHYKIPENQAQLEQMRKQANQVSEQLLNSATCAAALNKIVHNARNKERPWISQAAIQAYRGLKIYNVESANNIDNPDGAVFAGGVFIGVKGDPSLYHVCGYYEISGKVSRNEWPVDMQAQVTPAVMKQKAREIYQQKANALFLIYSSVSQAAQELVNGRPVLYGYKDLAEKIYVNSLTSIVKPKKMDNTLAQKIHQGKLAGWVNAGPFYFSLSKANVSELFASVSNPNDLEGKNIPHCSTPNCLVLEDNNTNANLLSLDRALEYTEEKALIKKSLYQANQFFLNDQHTFKHDMEHNEVFEESFVKQFKNQIDNDQTGVFKRIIDSVVNDNGGMIKRSELEDLMSSLKNTDQDPLYILGKLGNKILSITESNLLESIKNPQEFIDKIKDMQNPSTPDDKLNKIENNMFLTTLALAFFLTLWAAGASLALYIPFIPFMIYSVTSIGWLILVVEAIVAAPLLALSFVFPSGDELGKVTQGLMILLNIFLRPVLILFGFVLASRLFKAIFTLVHYGLSTYYLETIDQSNTILSSLALLIMYIVFIVSLTNKAFALIYMLPDKILRWVGGGPEQTDISQESQMTKGSLQRTGEVTQKMASYGTQAELERKSRYMKHHNETKPNE